MNNNFSNNRTKNQNKDYKNSPSVAHSIFSEQEHIKQFSEKIIEKDDIVDLEYLDVSSEDEEELNDYFDRKNDEVLEYQSKVNNITNSVLVNIHDFPNLPPPDNNDNIESVSNLLDFLKMHNKNIQEEIEKQPKKVANLSKEKSQQILDMERYKRLTKIQGVNKVKVKVISGVITIGLLVPTAAILSYSPLLMGSLGLSAVKYQQINTFGFLDFIHNLSNIKDNFLEINVAVEEVVMNLDRVYNKSGSEGVARYTVSLACEKVVGIISRKGIPLGILPIGFLQIPLVNSFINCGIAKLMTGGDGKSSITDLPDSISLSQRGIQLDKFFKDHPYIDPYGDNGLPHQKGYFDSMIESALNINPSKCNHQIAVLDRNVKTYINALTPELSDDELFVMEYEKDRRTKKTRRT